MVIGRYSDRKGTFIQKIFSKIYFFLFRILSGSKMPTSTSPLRVMNRSFIDAYNKISDKVNFPQSLDEWIGYRHQYITINHNNRSRGKSTYTLVRKISLAFDGLLYLSDRPLKILFIIGFLTSFTSMIFMLTLIVNRVIFNNYVPGFTFLAVSIIFFSGIIIFSLGMLGLYIGKIFLEVKSRPEYIIRKIY